RSHFTVAHGDVPEMIGPKGRSLERQGILCEMKYRRVRVVIPYVPIGECETIDDRVVITMIVGAGFDRGVNPPRYPTGHPVRRIVLACRPGELTPSNLSKRIEDWTLTGVRLEYDRMVRCAKVCKVQNCRDESIRRRLVVWGRARADED